jgi:hypothetical protein
MDFRDWPLPLTGVEEGSDRLKPFDVNLPRDLEFSDLQLRRRAGGGLTVSHSALSRFCLINALPLEELSEDRLCMVIALWYCHHRMNGGAADAIADELLFGEIAPARPARPAPDLLQ